MTIKIKKLDLLEIDLLRKHFEELSFPFECDFSYERQVPLTGLLLLSGEICFFKNKKLIGIVRPGFLLGVHNLINLIPNRFRWHVKKNSKLLIMPKSEILNVLTDHDSQVFPFIKELTG